MNRGKTPVGTVFASACCSVTSSHTAISTLLISTFSSSPLTLSIRVRVTPQAEKHAGRAVSNIFAFRCFIGGLFPFFDDWRAQKAVLISLGLAISRLVGLVFAFLPFSRIRHLLARSHTDLMALLQTSTATTVTLVFGLRCSRT